MFKFRIALLLNNVVLKFCISTPETTGIFHPSMYLCINMKWVVICHKIKIPNLMIHNLLGVFNLL